MGRAWAIFNFVGCFPVATHILYILLRGILNVKPSILRISVGIPLGPVPLCVLRPFISRNTLLGVVGSYANVSGLGFPKYLSKVLWIGVLFFSKILSATLEKRNVQ